LAGEILDELFAMFENHNIHTVTTNQNIQNSDDDSKINDIYTSTQIIMKHVKLPWRQRIREWIISAIVGGGIGYFLERILDLFF